MKKLSIASLILIAFAMSVFLIQKNKMSGTPAIEKIEKIACRNIVETCGNDFLSVRFSEPPQVMKLLHLLITVADGHAIQEVHANFAMKDMEMGFNRYQLIRTAEKAWQAEVTLPVCVQGRSDWDMLLEIKMATETKHVLVPFSAAEK